MLVNQNNDNGLNAILDAINDRLDAKDNRLDAIANRLDAIVAVVSIHIIFSCFIFWKGLLPLLVHYYPLVRAFLCIMYYVLCIFMY